MDTDPCSWYRDRVCRAVRVLLLLGPILSGCRGNNPVSVADRFVGRYYVERDFDAALAFAAGTAAARLESERRLAIQARKRSPEAQLALPRVYFERLGDPETGNGGTRVSYRLSSILAGSAPFEREVSVLLRPVREEWKVISFVERDPPTSR